MNKENISKRKSDINNEDQDYRKKLRLSEGHGRKKDNEEQNYLVQTDENNNMSTNNLISRLQSCQVNNHSNKDDDLDPFIGFQKLLKDVKTECPDSISGQAYQLPANPGLFIQNYGIVPLPINKIIADDMINILNKNKNDKVINNFQIDSSLVEIKNKDWYQNLEILVKEIADGLGLNGKIEAKLNKLLILKKGERLKKHAIKSAKNLIANLIILLPSVYEGGELVIYSKTKEQKDVNFDFCNDLEKSQFYPHFVAHYAEIEHELLEVKNGCRVILLYSLYGQNKNSYELNNNRYHVDKIEKLSYCLKKISLNKDNLFAILLDNSYYWHFQQGYGVESLENNDKNRYDLIKNANDSLPIENQMNFNLVNVCFTVNSFSPAEKYNINENFHEKTEEELKSQDWSEHVNDFKMNWFYENGGLIGFDTKLDVFTKIIDLNKKTLSFIDLNNLDSLNIAKQVCYKRTDRGYVRITKYDYYLLSIWPIKYQFEAFIKIDIKHALWELISSGNDQEFKPYPYYRQRFQELIHILKQNKNDLLDENNIILFFDKYKDIELCKYYLNNIPDINISLLSEFTRIFSCLELKSHLDERFIPITSANFRFLHVKYFLFIF
jgi:hypothetical protein